MNTDKSGEFKQNWMELKSKIKSKWNKFTDKDVEGLDRDFSQLPNRIRQVYGVDQIAANRQYDEFRMANSSLLPDKNYDTDRNPSATEYFDDDEFADLRPQDEHVIARNKTIQGLRQPTRNLSGQGPKK